MPRKKKLHPDIVAWNEKMAALEAKWDRRIELKKKLAEEQMTTDEFLELMSLLAK